MSDWMGALEAIGANGSTPTSAGAGPVQPGAGQVRSTSIPDGAVPDGVVKPDADVGDPVPAPRPAGKQSRSNLFSQDVPQDDPGSGDPANSKPTEPKDEGRLAQDQQSKGGIKQLREQYELTKREKTELESKVRELYEARETGTKAEVEKATKELRDEIAKIRQEREQAEQELRFARYTKSSEYREKFQKPLEAAYQQAMADIDGIVMQSGDGTERPAGWVDLEPIINAPTAKAAQLAREMFGDAASVILHNRAQIVRLQNEAKAAIDDYRAKGAEYEKQNEARALQVRESKLKAWRESMDRAVADRPSLYAKPDGDETLSKAWDTGDKLVRAAFLGELPPDVDVSDAEAFAIEAQAEVAARVRAFNVMAHRVGNLRQENAKLKARLAKLEGSEPTASASAGSRDASTPKGWQEALDSL